jgi:hypothetical protein
MGEVEVGWGSECVVQIERESAAPHRTLDFGKRHLKKKKRMHRTRCLNPQHSYSKIFLDWGSECGAFAAPHSRFRKTPSKKKKEAQLQMTRMPPYLKRRKRKKREMMPRVANSFRLISLKKEKKRKRKQSGRMLKKKRAVVIQQVAKRFCLI